MAFLKVIEGGYPGQILELAGGRVVIGRHPNSDIVLDRAAVSRHHAQILQNHGHFYLEDLRSRNKTFLNGQEIKKKQELTEADHLKICDMIFEFHMSRPTDSTLGIESSHSDPLTEESSVKPGGKARKLEETSPSLIFDDFPSGEELGNSSIISTLNVKSASHLRLGVKPEFKLRAVLDISKVLGRTLDIEKVLQKTLDGVFKIFPQAEKGFVLLKEFDNDKLVVAATKSRLKDDQDSVLVCMSVVRKAMADGEAILSHDVEGDKQFEITDSLASLKMRSMMCVPLLTIQGDALGVIQVNTKDLIQQFSQNDLDVLISVASQVTLAVENSRLHYSLLQQQNVEHDRDRDRMEMDLAVQVQLDFLPKEPPEVPSYHFYDFYEAALHVGGDYFDYIKLPDGRIAITLGDVAGKGVPAALLMAKLSSTARSYLLTKPTISEAVNNLNSDLASSGLGHRFVTFVVVVLDPEKNEVTIANAGHLPPILADSNGSVRELATEISSIPLGVIRGQQFKTETVPMNPGDSILIYTDGISEAMDDQDKVYGRKRLKTLMADTKEPAENLIHTVLHDVDEFTGDCPQKDDICVVCVSREK